MAGCAVLVAFGGWYPGTDLSTRWLRGTARRASHIAVSCLVDTTCRYVTPVLLGVFLPSSLVGLYFVANRLIASLSMLTFMSVNELCLPVLARLRTDRGRFDEAVYGTVRVTSLICLPAFVGLALVADPLVPLLFGERWSGAVGPLRLLAGLGIVPAWTAIAAQTLVAAGAPERATRINIRIALLLLLLVTPGAALGLMPATLGIMLAYLAAAPFAFADLRRFADLDARRLVTDQLPMITATALMVLAVLVTKSLLIFEEHDLLRLAVAVAVGASTYCAAIYALAPIFARTMAFQLRAAVLPARKAV